MTFILVVVALCALANMSFGAEPAPFCNGINCPSFTEKTVGDLEVRSYEKQLWTSTQIEGASLDDAVSIGFNRLFGYISGANVDNTKVDMTAPVLVKVLPGAGPNCNSTFTVNFFVPFEYQNDIGPPKPTDPTVYTSTIEAMDVAVNVFGGFPKQKEQIAEAAALQQKVDNNDGVQEDAQSAEEGSWYFAGYDAPYKLKNRHNEVWVKLATK